MTTLLVDYSPLGFLVPGDVFVLQLLPGERGRVVVGAVVVLEGDGVPVARGRVDAVEPATWCARIVVL